MFDIKDLINARSYSKILELEGSEYNRVKLISYIKLEKFHDGLLFLRKIRNDENLKNKLQNLLLTDMQFEEAYLLYKLKKYKKSYKILNCMEESDKKNILLSQVQYFLRNYEQAYNTLSKCKYEKERDINLQAIESLSKSSIIQPNNKLEITQYNFGKLESIAEYNKSFEHFQFYNQDQFIKRYKNSKNEKIQLQIQNLMNSLDAEKFQGRKKDIIAYNIRKTKTFKKELLHKNPRLLKEILKTKNDISNVSDMDLKNCLLFLKDLDYSEDVTASINNILKTNES